MKLWNSMSCLRHIRSHIRLPILNEDDKPHCRAFDYDKNGGGQHSCIAKHGRPCGCIIGSSGGFRESAYHKDVRRSPISSVSTHLTSVCLGRGSSVWTTSPMTANMSLSAMRYAPLRVPFDVRFAARFLRNISCLLEYCSFVAAFCSVQIAAVSGHGIFHCKSSKLEIALPCRQMVAP
jgi:hypothetical protein